MAKEFMFLKKRQPSSSTAGGGPEVEDKLFEDTFPALWEMMVATVWPDGKPRRVATVLILCEDGCFKVWLNDRDQGQSAWFTGRTVQEALAAAEDGLRDDTAQWRRTQPQGGGRGQKKS